MMILEFMQFGDLHTFMVNNKPTSKSSGLPLSTLYSIAMDVSVARITICSSIAVYVTIIMLSLFLIGGYCFGFPFISQICS